jgi:hypothetical protein
MLPTTLVGGTIPTDDLELNLRNTRGFIRAAHVSKDYVICGIFHEIISGGDIPGYRLMCDTGGRHASGPAPWPASRAPEGPTIASVCPFGITRVSPLRTGRSPSYAKTRSLKRIDSLNGASATAPGRSAAGVSVPVADFTRNNI